MAEEIALEQRARVEEFQRKHRIGLLTLLFTDLVGSTKLKQELGDRESVALIQQHHALVREILQRYPEGEEIGTAGDSFFLVFAKPSDAVQFSLLLQSKLRALCGESSRPLLDRIGVHIGEVVIEERPGAPKPKDMYGLQVDICARVMSLAEGDQILLTRSAFDNARQVLKGEAVEGVGSLVWMNHGPYLLKGVEEPMEICEVGESKVAILKPPEDSDKVHRLVSAESEPVLGWRPALGQKVAGTHWVLEEKLGEGGFGEVWLGRHDKTKEQRVFKFCFRADRVRALRREVTLFRLLKERVGEHPNIVRLLEVYFEEPPFYLEMEYVAGGDLGAWSTAQGGIEKIPLATRLEIVAQIADALQAAHDSGVIHRDVKPSNIVVVRGPIRHHVGLAENSADGALEELTESPAPPGSVHVKLTDFGIGQVVSDEVLADMTRLGFTETMVSPGSAVPTGTQIYMAPELLSGQPPSIRSDIYSLGVVLYQVLAGDLSRPLTMDWANDVSDPYLREALAHCFAGKPQERFSSTGQLAENLRTVEQRRKADRLRVAAAHRKKWQIAGVVMAAVVLIPTLLFLGLKWKESRGAGRVLRDLGTVYQGLESYQDSMDFTIEAEIGGIQQNISGTAQIAFVHPDKLSLTLRLATSVTRLLGDGQSVWTSLSLGPSQYALKDSTNSAEAVLKQFSEDPVISQQWMGLGPVASLHIYRQLVSSDPATKLVEDAQDVHAIGRETMNGNATVMVAWRERNPNGPGEIPVTVWVDENEGLIRKMQADLTEYYNSVAKTQANAAAAQKFVVTTTHRDIRVNDAVPENLFTFSPVDGARKVERFDVAGLIRASQAGVFPYFRRTELEAKIPARDPSTRPEMIDLSRHFTVPLTERSHSALEGNDLSSLPQGVQRLAGVEFDIRGEIQLSSSGIRDAGGRYPEKVGIEIGLTVRRLHFLHAVINGNSSTSVGTRVGSYTIHYVDGEEREIPIIYGRDLRDWWARDFPQPADAGIAWQGTNTASQAQGSAIRLYKSTWENPRPSVPIERLEFISAMESAVAPFLVAVTGEPEQERRSEPAGNAIDQLRSRIGIVDLSAYYNDDIGEMMGERPGNDLSSLPRGLQEFAGIQFDIRGIVHLSSKWSELQTGLDGYEKAVRGIKVGRKCQRIHFLHATHWVAESDPVPVASYVVNFENDEKQEFPVIFGKDILDWWAREAREASRAIIAWTGTNRVSGSLRSAIRLYMSTWTNSTPDAVIESFDFVSKMAQPAPFLVAATVDPVAN